MPGIFSIDPLLPKAHIQQNRYASRVAGNITLWLYFLVLCVRFFTILYIVEYPNLPSWTFHQSEKKDQKAYMKWNSLHCSWDTCSGQVLSRPCPINNKKGAKRNSHTVQEICYLDNVRHDHDSYPMLYGELKKKKSVNKFALCSWDTFGQGSSRPYPKNNKNVYLRLNSHHVHERLALGEVCHDRVLHI